MIEDNATHDPPTSGAPLLAEVIHTVEQLSHEASAYPAIYDLAMTCDQSGFFEWSLVLYDRCLRIAVTDEDRQIAYTKLTAAFCAAASAETDPVQRSCHLRDGIYAATAALDPEGSQQIGPTCAALAHRSLIFAQLGHHRSALCDARRAREMALAHGMRREQVVAAVGEVIARWHSCLDTTVLTLIDEAKTLAEDLDVGDSLRQLLAIEVDVLWSLGRHAASLPSFMRAGWFAVHVLGSHQQALSTRFATRGADKFAGLAFAEGLGGCPVLAGGVAHFECSVHDRVPAGDHVIFLGRVERMSHRDAEPLVFSAGQYCVPALLDRAG